MLMSCNREDSSAVRVDPALLSLVPSDTVILSGLKLEILRQTPVWKKYVARLSFPALDNMAHQTGLDLRGSAWEALIASDGKTAIVMARGDFAPQGLEPRMNRPGLTRTPYRGYTLIGNDQGVVVFMNPSTALAGLPAAVRSVIDQRGHSGPSPALRDLLHEIPKENQIWIASAGGYPALPESGNAANFRHLAMMADGFVAGADLRSGLAAFAKAQCRNEDTAKSLTDTLHGFLALARLSTSANQSALQHAYDGVHIDQQRNAVRVNVALSEELLESAAGALTR